MMTSQELTDKPIAGEPESGKPEAGEPYGSESFASESFASESFASSLARVTPEHIAYMGIAVLAAVLRFADLGLAPLNPGEALEALAIWDLWLPGGAAAMPGSSAYFAVTAPLTQVAGFADSVMRFVPAVFGFALVLTPWFLRHRSGRLGALIAALLLAVSPMQAIASRTAGGATIALFAGMLVFIAWLRYQDNGERRWLYALAVALALGFAASPLFYGMLATLALAWLAQSVIGPALIRDLDGQRATLTRPSGPELRTALVIGLATFLAIATTLFLALRGIGSSADLLWKWFQEFQLVATATLRATPLLITGRYELGLLLIGLPAAIWGALKEKPYPIFLVYWVLGGLLMMLLQPGSLNNVLILTLPGYLLVGRFSNDILRRTSSSWWWAFAAAIVFSGAIIYLNLVRFARLSGQQGVPASTYHLLIAFIAVLVIIILTALLWTWDKSAAAKGAVAGLLALLLVFTWGSAWWISRDAANDTRERWLATATDNDIRLVVESLEELSWRASNSADDVVVDVAVDTPALRWYLKDFSNASFAETLPASALSPILITPLDYDPQVAGNYLGTEYGYSHLDTVHSLAWIDALRWWLFHQSPIPLNEERLVLWLRADLAEASP